NLDRLTPRLSQNLSEHEDQVRKNAEATPLIRDVPLDCDVADLRMGGWELDEVRNLFNFLEFRTLWDRLVDAVDMVEADGADEVDVEPFEVDVDRVQSTDDAVAIFDRLASHPGPLGSAISWVGLEGRSDVTGLALAPEGSRATWLDASLLDDPAVSMALGRLVGPDGPPLHAHRAKELMRGLNRYAVDVESLDLDTAVAAYLVDPGEGNYDLQELCARYAGIELRSPDAPPPGQLDLDGSSPDLAVETARRAAAVARLGPPLGNALEARGLRPLYDDIERPLIPVLARMEKVGVRVDAEYLRSLVDDLTQEVHQLDAEIQELAGRPFLVNSTKQLREVLFDELGLQPQKKTKTGFSTDAASLARLKGQHPVVDKLLRYREVEKLRSTYGESLLAEVGADGRIHATFQQTVARTGRLSSDRPNLHNIPIRTEEGRRFRRAFVPEEGWSLLVADYNQIELRVIAHLAQDPGLIDAFESDLDIHTATAARVFDVEAGAVTLAQRSKAKMISYGLAYGMEAYGLSQRLGVAVDEAAVILAAYFEAFPKVKSYMDTTVEEARQRGYTETLFGRRRLIPELSSSNYRIRQAGERQAMNAGIQGLAADIFKAALVKLDAALEREHLQSRLILQVHDEVILEVPPDEARAASELTLDAMHNACQLCVPLEVNLAWGVNWAEAKG
ncbi:MAG: DNA polymerase I, partial [Actinomycetota bacterium]|nr:DNA polymerase I [Actinomycetota bacterium]